jgi:phage terminase large subunit-like protein
MEAMGLDFDVKTASRVIRFFSLLKHSKGEWAGQVFRLEPWQEFILWNLFGWKWKVSGLRRFRTGYIEVARKNGKSTFFAGIGLYLFAYDDEPGAEVYTAATKRDQAKIVWGEAKRMVQRSPTLKKKIKMWRTSLTVDNTACKFEPLGADEDTLDGLNPHAAIIDELHAHKSRGVWDILETASGARRQPIQVAITTAGFDKHTICWEQHAYLEKILTGVIPDETYFGMIYTLDPEDKWEDESVWVKANPNLEISVKREDLQMQAARARDLPTQLNSFLRLRMNIWTESEVRWLPPGAWDRCGDAVDIEGLRGRLCYAGLDLSSTQDLTALVHVFPPETDDDTYKFLCRFFMPQDNVHARVKQDRVPYDVWIRQGFITTTPGNVVDYEYVLKQITEDADMFDVQEIGFDRWGASRIQIQLADMGFTVVPIGQGFQSMSPPMKEMEKLILKAKIAHGGNPVLRWMASNVVVRTDPAGNIKADKSRSVERIDGVVAAIMALDRAERVVNNTSIYETRGVLTYGPGG